MRSSAGRSKPNVVFDGYWGRPEATVEMFRNLWMHSGDIGRLDADRFLYFMDRKADYMRRRGENVSSYEIEEVFIRHPAVADVAVFAVPSPVTEDDIMVAVELAAGATVTEEELFRWSLDAIPYFALPRYVEIRDELPRSDMKKILKGQLREEGVGPNTWDADTSGIDGREAMTRAPAFVSTTLGELFGEVAAAFPDAVAYVEGDDRLTYSRVGAARRLARGDARRTRRRARRRGRDLPGVVDRLRGGVRGGEPVGRGGDRHQHPARSHRDHRHPRQVRARGADPRVAR